MIKEERLQRLKQWLHRTQLQDYEFYEVLKRKRKKELIQIAVGDGSELKKGQYPQLYKFLKQIRSRYYYRNVGNNLIDVSIDGYHHLVLYHNGFLSTTHGWICGPYRFPTYLDPIFWLKFDRWTSDCLVRLIESLPDLLVQWPEENEYIEQEFVKIEKLRNIRSMVRNLRENKVD